MQSLAIAQRVFTPSAALHVEGLLRTALLFKSTSSEWKAIDMCLERFELHPVNLEAQRRSSLFDTRSLSDHPTIGHQ